MKNLNIIEAYPESMLRLQAQLGGNITEEYGIFTLEFDNSFGFGHIKHHNIVNDVSVFDVTMTLNIDFCLNIGVDNNNLLYLIYCTEGLVYFKSETSNHYNKIEELRPAIVTCNHNSNNQLHIKKNVKIECNLMTINKEQYFKKCIGYSDNEVDSLNSLIMTLDGFESKLHHCSYNLKIANKLSAVRNELITLPIVSILKIKSLYILILGLHLEQFLKETYEETPIATLTKSELQKIRQLTEFISRNPEIQHSIANLCRKITISPAKLQEGFKGMHKTTVADFVRHVRIVKSEKLLQETDLNISEIVYTIGLTSRSYFCKIFKKEYGVSPKKYRKLIREKSLQDVCH